MKADAVGSRHPFEIFTLVLCIFVGLPLLIGDARPGSISAALPEWAENVWGLLLVVGACTALVSLRMANRALGLVVEQVGLVMVGSATLFYAGAVLLYVGLEAAVSAIFVLGFGLSCLWRWVQLQGVLNTAKNVLEERADG